MSVITEQILQNLKHDMLHCADEAKEMFKGSETWALLFYEMFPVTDEKCSDFSF